MLQFNIYQVSGETEKIRDYTLRIRNSLKEGKLALIGSIVEANEASLKNQTRYHLINSRLALWGIIESHWAQLACTFCEQNSNKMTYFELTEVASCASAILRRNDPLECDFATFLKAISTEKEAKDLNFFNEFENNKIHYMPRRSGFFSTIENIINAAFYASNQNSMLALPPQNHWWPYPLDIANLLQMTPLRSLISFDNQNPNRYITFDQPRQFIRGTSSEKLGKFARWKHLIYSDMLEEIQRSLGPSMSQEILESIGQPVLFIRGGDKLDYETVQIPDPIVGDMLNSVSCCQAEKIAIISDSFELSKNMSKKFSNHPLKVLTPPSQTGYFHSKHMNSSEGTKIMLAYFCLIAQSPIPISDPSSNLVNAAHWAKFSPLVIHPQDIRRYSPITRHLFY
jgi:hypothetical protein